MGLSLSSGPSVEPVSLAEAKAHLRVDTADDDDLITSLIQAAREYVENVTRRQLVTATWVLTRDNLAAVMELVRPPLQSVTSVKYTDLAGDQQTASDTLYDVDADTLPGRILLGCNQGWPTNRGHTNDVEITYKAGYGDATTDVPEAIRAAIKLLIGHWHENREAVVAAGVPRTLELAVGALLFPYRTYMEVG